jgi:4'-phosphopantetheinyl transferase
MFTTSENILNFHGCWEMADNTLHIKPLQMTQKAKAGCHADSILQILYSRVGNIFPRKVEEDFLAIMPAGIRASILRYRRWQDRQATLSGRLLLLRALCLKCNDTAMEKFQSQQVGEHGKPFIAGGPEFNISHSGDIVVLALADKGRIGIDIEEIRHVETKDYLRQLPEMSNVDETLGGDHGDCFFFDCWTRKEAVLKAGGQGLLAPLEDVVLGEDSARFLERSWHIHKIPVEEGYCCHVAIDRPVQQLSVEYVDLMHIQSDLCLTA